MALIFEANVSTIVPAKPEEIYPDYTLKRVIVRINEGANNVSMRCVCTPVDANGVSLESGAVVIQEQNLYDLGQPTAVDNFINRLEVVTNALGIVKGVFK